MDSLTWPTHLLMSLGLMLTFPGPPGTFQAHLAQVQSPDHVENVLHALLANRKVAAATHNIMAYRIHQDQSATVRHCLQFLTFCAQVGKTGEASICPNTERKAGNCLSMNT